MSTWALVPIKRRASCKQRLASVLSQPARQELVSSLLNQVLRTVSAAAGIDHVAVISSERGEIPATVTLIPDDEEGLNASLEKGIQRAISYGATLVLIIAADLPLLRVDDVTKLLAAARENGIALAPDRHERGTNAICMRADSRLRMQMGANSFIKHCRQLAAALAGMNGVHPQGRAGTAVIRTHSLGFDLDTPQDWEFFNRQNADHAQIDELLRTPLDELMAEAQRLTLAGHGCAVSYSRKVFIPLTQLCRDVCHYCTFAKAPRALASPYLSLDEVLRIARAGEAAGCKEALFTLGDQPEKRYASARRALEKMGYASTLEYLAAAAGLICAETTLLPHLNPGILSASDIQRLRPVSASMGIMLEIASERLSLRGGPHWGSPDKMPAARLATVDAAGEQTVPLTTGLLIGIGETRRERLESLLALRAIHVRHGHIQEVILQNFRAKQGTKMAEAPEPTLEEQLWTIAAARLIFGPSMSIQSPPNLRPTTLTALIRAGVNDWGGVSPVTPDHVNPEAPWPHLESLRRDTAAAGRELIERLAIGPRYARDPVRWVDPGLQAVVRRKSDAGGFARTEAWHAGAGEAPPQESSAWLTPDRRRSGSSVHARLIERAVRGEALLEDEIAGLFNARARDLTNILLAADELRQEVCGDPVTFVINRNINYTNICTYRCGFCAFSKGRSAAGLRGPAYRLDLAEIARRTVEAGEAGATEVCLQGGIHPSFTGETYLDIVGAVKAAVPHMHIHAFSPLEVTHGAQTLGLSVAEYLRKLHAAGLSSLPGTAAEILDDEVRSVICSDKINTEQWLGVMRDAHESGLRSTATIMFGHVDGYQHWARHLLRIRGLQHATGGFTEFVPLAFVHMEAPMWRRGQARSGPTFREAVLMHALARLVLHSEISNIQTSWVKMGAAGAAYCLRSGANDLGGTLMNESITRAAGGVNGQEFGPERIAEVAATVSRPVRQRTTFYGSPALPLPRHIAK